jgi:putative tricarboxylic transport membrane protein
LLAGTALPLAPRLWNNAPGDSCVCTAGHTGSKRRTALLEAPVRSAVHNNNGGGDVAQRIPGAQDFFAGLLFAGFGVLALYLGRDYPIGSAMRMGPGYFPMVLGAILTVLGLLILVKGLVVRGPAMGRFALLPAFLILLSVALFAITVERAGILVAVALVTIVGALPSGAFRWREVIPLLVVMAALAVGLFTKGLGLPFKVFPW